MSTEEQTQSELQSDDNLQQTQTSSVEEDTTSETTHQLKEQDSDPNNSHDSQPSPPDRSDSPDQGRAEVPPLRTTDDRNDRQSPPPENLKGTKGSRKPGSRRGRTSRTQSADGTSMRRSRSHSQSQTSRGSGHPGLRQSYRFEMTGRSASAGRFSKRERRHNTIIRNFQGDDLNEIIHDVSRYQRSPGPVYNTGYEIDKNILRRSTTVKIGTAPRTSSVHTIGPGPAYSGDVEKLASHPKSPRATIGRAPREGPKKDATPSSADYQAPSIDLLRRHQPRATIGKERRGGPPGEKTPGPSDYSTYNSRKYSSTRGTFSTQERGTGSWIFA
ncbi:hypothetical protein BLNAU_15409 [Blattamonas nauphoetae]|uniref:Uncharacterized protein n=1 Tax=Blattamonas nauphoetae TaxID=2049346 RepID=A0ABQ9XAV9_9EUKA|nr:hypothetical protein BLNAU_15409 [Blattamonas nauphoetae]